MRHAVVMVLGIFFIVGVSAATAYAFDVSYSTSTTGQQTICPVNSVLQGTLCYCNAGYKVSGTSCVKDEAMPPGSYEIYQDISVAISINEDLNCDKLGYISGVDGDMCKRYYATPPASRYQWKSIPRPTTNQATITNPWAPAGQQTLNFLSGSTSQTIPANLPPPPPPPTPEPVLVSTSTAPAPTPEPEPQKIEPVATGPSEEELAAKALAELQKKKEEEKKIAEEEAAKAKVVEATSTAEIPPQPQPDPFAQIASAQASQNPVDIATVMAGLELIPASESTPAPETSEPEPEKPQSFFGRVFGWLFGWL